MAGIDAHANHKEEQADTDLAEQLKYAEGGVREETCEHRRRHPTEQGRAQQNARGHFTDHRWLADS